MAKKPVKTVKLPPEEAENRRLFAHTQMNRYVVAIAAGESAVEISPKPGCRLSFTVESDGTVRRIRIIASEIKPAPVR